MPAPVQVGSYSASSVAPGSGPQRPSAVERWHQVMTAGEVEG